MDNRALGDNGQLVAALAATYSDTQGGQPSLLPATLETFLLFSCENDLIMDTDNLKLIEDIEKRPEIWDVTGPQYKEKGMAGNHRIIWR
jgi:hypothetical protein